MLHYLAKSIFLASGVFVPFLAATVHAQGPGWSNYGLPFLLTSPSAVAHSMGGGAVAASTEASAIKYNPAALSRTGRIALEGNTFKLLPQLADDLRYSYFAGVFQIPSTNRVWLGAAYDYVNLGEQIITGELDPTPLGTFKTYETALALAAGTKLNQHLSLGLSFKYLRSVLAPPVSNTTQRREGTASVYAIDLGFLYDGFLPQMHFSRQFLPEPLSWQNWAHKGLAPGFSLGVTLANLELKSKLAGEAVDDLMPHSLRIGLAWNLLESDVAGLMLTGERTEIFLKKAVLRPDPIFRALFTAWADESFDDQNIVFYTAGFEVNLLYLAAIRCGHHWDEAPASGYNTFGFSLGPPGLRFSYATTLDDDVLYADRNIYSISLVLDKLP